MKKKNFVIIGLGRFGKNVAMTLENMKYEVLAIDIDQSAVSSVAKDLSHCVIADSTKLDTLKELGVDSIDHAVVAIGNNLEASILTVTNLRKMGVKRITVRVDEESHKDIFQLLGADEMIVPEEAAALELAHQIYNDGLLEYRFIAKDYVMAKIIVGSSFVSDNLINLDFRNKYNINIVGIEREGVFFIPKGQDEVKPTDIIVAAGKRSQIRAFIKYLTEN